MESILKSKSYAFAIRIVKLSQYLREEKREFVMSHQILKSGTAIGALVWEAEYGQSKLDFVNKLSVSLKEANETDYWLNLLRDTGYIDEVMFSSLMADCKEILRLLISSIKTAKKNIK